MQKNRLGLWLSSFIFFTFSGVLQYGCQSSDHGNLDTASGNAAEIYVFYPENWEDSIQDIFTTTVFLADSSLVRFEENRKKEDRRKFILLTKSMGKVYLIFIHSRSLSTSVISMNVKLNIVGNSHCKYKKDK